MVAQRKYKDSDGAQQYAQMDARTISGGAGDVPLVRPVSGALNFGSSSTGNVFDAVTAVGLSPAITVDGFENLMLRVESSSSTATIKIRPWLLDASGVMVPLAEITVSLTTKQGSTSYPTKKSNRYHCILIAVPTNGAKEIKVELTQLSTGNVTIWGVGR